MLRSTERILTSHAGSLLRPLEVMKFVKAKDARQPYDDKAFAGVLDEAVDDVIREQARVGIDIVNDGEFSRTSYCYYVLDRLAGYEMKQPGGDIISSLDQVRSGNLTPGTARARKRFGDFVDVWSPIERTMWMPAELQDGSSLRPPTEVPVCTSPIRYAGMDELTQDLTRLKSALAGVNVEGAFVTVASPSVAAYVLSNNAYYATEDEYLFALADALNVEYRAITNAGFDIQIDSPELCHLYDPEFEDEYLRWLSVRIDAINQALEGIPEDKARLHVCWGSGNGPHVNDVPLRLIIDQVLRVRTQGYSLEGANDRHAHEVLMWDDVKLPEGKILMPGVVGHVSNIIEHPELVAWRIKLYAERVGKENVIAGTDCGYSQGWDLRRVHPQIQWAKLETLAEGARLASHQLWGAQQDVLVSMTR
jgi:5-methyltetrahydropteroyltriglutamate--homocysteine methyltransferase